MPVPPGSKRAVERWFHSSFACLGVVLREMPAGFFDKLLKPAHLSFGGLGGFPVYWCYDPVKGEGLCEKSRIRIRITACPYRERMGPVSAAVPVYPYRRQRRADQNSFLERDAYYLSHLLRSASECPDQAEHFEDPEQEKGKAASRLVGIAISTGPALLLQEFRNLGTILFVNAGGPSASMWRPSCTAPAITGGAAVLLRQVCAVGIHRPAGQELRHPKI